MALTVRARFWLGWSLVLACGGAGSHPGDTGAPAALDCTGPVSARSHDALRALAACVEFSGDLTITGGAVSTLAPLARLERISGSLRIGPTLALGSVDHLEHLRAVGGSLRIHTNLDIDGVFLPALERVGGDFELAGNSAMTGANAPALVWLGGDLRVAGNVNLERLDLGALAHLGGRFELAHNPKLELLELDPALHPDHPAHR